MPRSERFWVWMLATTFAAAYAVMGLLRHWQYGSSMDLAIFDQAVWHLIRFEVPGSTISGHTNILGDHFYPIVALFALPYRVVPAPETLIVTQAVALGAAVVPVFVFLRRRLAFGPSILLAASFGLFWGMQRTAGVDVHEFAFAPLFVASALLAIDLRRWGWLWIACTLLVLTKEDMIPLVMCLGLYVMWTGERRRGAVLAVAGFGAFLLVTRVVIPWFNDGGVWSARGSFEAVFERPWMAPLVFVTPPEKLRTLLLWFAPFLLLSLRSPLSVLVLPIAAERLLSISSTHWGAGGHYSAPLAPILAMSAGDGLARLGLGIQNVTTRRRLVAGLAVGVVLVSAILPGHQPHWRLFSPSRYRLQPFETTANRALAVVPPDASVVAQAALTPHLSQRHQIYLLKPLAPDADYVLASSALGAWPLASMAEIDLLLQEYRSRGYGVVFEEDGWVVLKHAGAK